VLCTLTNHVKDIYGRIYMFKNMFCRSNNLFIAIRYIYTLLLVVRHKKNLRFWSPSLLNFFIKKSSFCPRNVAWKHLTGRPACCRRTFVCRPHENFVKMMHFSEILKKKNPSFRHFSRACDQKQRFFLPYIPSLLT